MFGIWFTKKQYVGRLESQMWFSRLVRLHVLHIANKTCIARATLLVPKGTGEPPQRGGSDE
jgi:hypothetical protein